MTNEATVRIKVNELLKLAGWHVVAEDSAPANIRLEPCVTIKLIDLKALGDNFEKAGKGFPRLFSKPPTTTTPSSY